MKRATGGLLAASLLAAIVALPAAPALAVETSNSEFVVIPEGDVLADDLYAGAIKVSVAGELDGDLVAFAAEEVVITGAVTGSVFVVAPSVVIDGSVGGTVRAVAGELSVAGSVGGDLVAGGLDIDLGDGSAVAGDVLAWAREMRSVGSIAGDLEGSQRALSLAGRVGRDVDVSVGALRVVDALEVGGDLGYRSEGEGTGLDQAVVGGVVVERSPLPPNIRVRALALLTRLVVVILLTIAALTLAWAWPEWARSAADEVGGSPLASWAYGAPVAFSPLIVAAVAGLILALAPPAAGLPLVAVLVPLALAAVGLVGALALAAGAPVVAWVGRRLSRRLDLHWAIIAGSVVVGVAWSLPIVGWLVPVVVLPLGLGASIRGVGRSGLRRP